MNEGIIENLGILAKYYKKNGDKWRQQSYNSAVISIKSFPLEITHIKQTKGIKGIGKSIQDKIKEYLDTGEISLVEEVKDSLKQETRRDAKESTIELFLNVWGIGPVKAKSLWNSGIRSIKDLKKNQHLLTSTQKIGLKYYKDLLRPIPRQYIDIFQLAVKYVLIRDFGKNSFKMEIAGSYRRGEIQSGDVDCLITSNKFDLSQIVKSLQKWGIITEVLSLGDEKFMGIVHCPGGNWYNFRMDIEFLPEDEYGAGLLYFTGSKGFNMSMRNDSKKKGYILNQHGLFYKNGDRVPVFTEKEIMNELGMKYVPPNKR